MMATERQSQNCICPKYSALLAENARLEAEVLRLKAKLSRQERTAKEGYFGSSTPSSQVPLKASTPEDRRLKRGGAVEGHDGHGRSSVSEEDADAVVADPAPCACPGCGGPLEDMGDQGRTVWDCEPPRARKILHKVGQAWCPCCRKTYRGRAAGVMPGKACSNRLIAHMADAVYREGMTAGTLSRRLGVGTSTIHGALAWLAGVLETVDARLVQEYRAAHRKHADETKWMCDGKSGYAWLFVAGPVAIFRFRETRSAKVPMEVFGKSAEHPHTGVLGCDRYGGYPAAWDGRFQYCYEHLKRKARDLVKDNPGDKECEAFAEPFAGLLIEAMKLRGRGLPLCEFLAEGERVSAAIKAMAAAPARHPSVQDLQNIFREKEDRLFEWAKDPAIPAENNAAESGLRPLVICRKISLGSQSAQGLNTREVCMSVMVSLAKRGENPALRLTEALDALAENPALDIAAFLFPTLKEAAE